MKKYKNKSSKPDGARNAKASQRRGGAKNNARSRRKAEGRGANRGGNSAAENRSGHKSKHNAPRSKNAAADLFGMHAVREAWLNRARTIEHLYVSAGALEGFQSVIEQAQTAGLVRPAPQVMDKAAITNLCANGAVHQGIAAVCRPLTEVSVTDLIIKARARVKANDGDGKAVFLMLDQVTDPHNVGALIRSASAFGADGIIMQCRHAPALTGVLAKTACGAVEHIDVAYETNLARCIEELQAGGFNVYGLDERGDVGISNEEIINTQQCVLVLGAEGSGLRRLVAEKCDRLVRLPTGGAIASLNVSNAGAVALYAVLS